MKFGKLNNNNNNNNFWQNSEDFVFPFVTEVSCFCRYSICAQQNLHNTQDRGIITAAVSRLSFFPFLFFCFGLFLFFLSSWCVAPTFSFKRSKEVLPDLCRAYESTFVQLLEKSPRQQFHREAGSWGHVNNSRPPMLKSRSLILIEIHALSHVLLAVKPGGSQNI